MSSEIDLLEIPPEVQQKILPDESLSILDFLQFPLPAVARSPINDCRKYLSSRLPTITSVDQIQTVPTPSLDVIKELARSPDITLYRSILCPHAPGLLDEGLPMWIISYWMQIADIRPLKTRWAGAEQSLQALKNSKASTTNTKGLMIETYNALACTSWSGVIKGFPASITTDHLSHYLTKDWLTDEHENQMLYLLQQEAWRKRPSDGIEVVDTFFMEKLSEIYKEEDNYATKSAYAWIRKIGQDLATGVQQTLVTIANINKNHWVAIVVDFERSKIRYADSMARTIHEDVERVLTWWINHHTGWHFTTSYLPITRQRDGHSCGVLAWNALAVHLFPETYSLPDAKAVGDERLKMFLQICNRHNEKVHC